MFQKIATCGFVALLTILCLARAEASSANDCSRKTGLPHFYDGIERVAFILEAPILLQDSFDCHGHEAECAAKKYPADAPSSSKRKVYVEYLKRDYQPHASITPAYLTKKYTQYIQWVILSKLRTSSCAAPELITDSRQAKEAAGQPNTLVVYVEVNTRQRHEFFGGKDRDEIVILRTAMFRPDLQTANVAIHFYKENVLAIKMGWPDGAVSNAVSNHISDFLAATSLL